MLPAAPSAVKIEGMQHFTSQGAKDYETPRELTAAEIRQIIADYAQAAKNAVASGFDGVELHAANGRLPAATVPRRFRQPAPRRIRRQHRQQSPLHAGRMRALIDAVGGERVGIKISPLHPYAGIAFDNPVASYEYLIGELNKLDFAFVEIMQRSPMFPLLPHYPQGDELAIFAPMVQGKTVIAGTGYTAETGEAALENGAADLIAYGAAFLANPDLPKRFELGAELNTPDRATMFGGGERGYTDYPFLK